MAEPILTVKDLQISFPSEQGVTPVLTDFSLDLYPGFCMGLVGESGSGKTLAGLSLLQLLPHAALVSASSHIQFQSQSLLALPEKKMRHIRGRCISMIFQDALSALNPVLTIGQQLDEMIRFHFSFSRRQSRIKSVEILESVGLPSPLRIYESYPHQLSGGMRQRVMIAMATASEPVVIIADEPTTALDVTVQSQILALLKKLKTEKQCALLFIGHDLSVVAEMADEITVLQKGATVEKGRATDFFRQPVHPYSQQLLRAVLPLKVRRTGIAEKWDEPILTVNQLKVVFKNDVKAVDDVSFSIYRGETVALVGESGSGKTTTAKGILQLLAEAEGEVIFQNQTLNVLSKRALRKVRPDIQFIFQDPASALNPRMLIADSLAEGLVIQKRVKNRTAALQVIDGLLQQVGLSPEMKWRYPHEFSGGQKQRLCIARALSLSPRLLILDEPTSSLDVSIQKEILDLLVELQEKNHLSYLLITHNLSVVAYLADRVMVMYDGKIVETGETNAILTQPQHSYTKSLLAGIFTTNDLSY